MSEDQECSRCGGSGRIWHHSINPQKTKECTKCEGLGKTLDSIRASDDLVAFREYIHEDIKLHGIERQSDGAIHIDLDGAAVELYITPEGMLDVHVDSRIKEDILD